MHLQPITKDYWDGAAEVVISLGYPRVKSIFPGLLEWIQDMNWLGASRISVFLREIGEPIVPYIKDILNHHRSDTVWIEWIIEKIIDHWNTEQILQIRDELILISQEKDNDLRALRILLIHGLYHKQEVYEIIQSKIKDVAFKLKEFETTNTEIDCDDLDGFNICYAKSNFQTYLSDIEFLRLSF